MKIYIYIYIYNVFIAFEFSETWANFTLQCTLLFITSANS
jgi:hypothetical protein